MLRLIIAKSIGEADLSINKIETKVHSIWIITLKESERL